MRKLCAFPKRENASLILIQENKCVYWSENQKISNFSLNIIYLGVISCEESIARIPESWKRFPNPDSGKLVHVGFSLQYTHLFPWTGSRKHFHVSGMRAIDFSHDFTPNFGGFWGLDRRVIFTKKIFSLKWSQNAPPLTETVAYFPISRTKKKYFERSSSSSPLGTIILTLSNSIPKVYLYILLFFCLLFILRT
jgi:hypothetical protein